MKANTAIGIGAGIACLLLSVIMEGGNPAALLGIPALIIVVGGTFGATFASTTMEQMKRIVPLYKKAFGGNNLEPHVAIRQMVALADKARRDGLLALEDDLAEVEDDFTKKGVQLVVDGTDSDLVRAILSSEVDGMAQRHIGREVRRTVLRKFPTCSARRKDASCVRSIVNAEFVSNDLEVLFDGVLTNAEIARDLFSRF